MKIIIGSDHRGYELKNLIKNHFADIQWTDAGTDNGNDRVDYPVFTKRACEEVLAGNADRAIVICGSGVGVSMAANRFKRIYAALCCSPAMAKAAREHDNANVLALSSDFTPHEVSLEIVKVWLETEFAGGKYQERLEMIEI